MTHIRPKLVVGVAAIITFLILMSLTQEMSRRWQVQREVQRLESEVQELQKGVIELGQLNDYFRTDDYQERLARENLNYKAPGEAVVLLPDEELSSESQPQKEQQNKFEDSLPMRWWKLFFVDPILTDE